ncbi:MAG: hypothetical protein M1837_004084 [Sclerophora amabilis]|nr:MAG: hypothetical protein M1837_004084 [Sclerophora amabilis]
MTRLLTDDSEPDESCQPRLQKDAFQRLVEDLSSTLGPCSGLTSDDVEVGHLTRQMEDYISSQSEWVMYAHKDLSRPYTRNLVDHGNGKSNLVRCHILEQRRMMSDFTSSSLSGRQAKLVLSMITQMPTVS